jgi:hypothetical protein
MVCDGSSEDAENIATQQQDYQASICPGPSNGKTQSSFKYIDEHCSRTAKLVHLGKMGQLSVEVNKYTVDSEVMDFADGYSKKGTDRHWVLCESV